MFWNLRRFDNLTVRVQPFAYFRPESRGEVFAALREFAPDVRILAGGTDLMVRLRSGRFRPNAVVDVKRVSGWSSQIVETERVLRVGAGVTMTDLVSAPSVQQHFPALVEAASVVGSVQIRNRATLAGNICNASPAADTAPPLLVYGAVVNVASRAGERQIPLSEFFLGPGRTALAAGELVESIDLPIPVEAAGSAFQRITRRRGVDLATANLSCSVNRAGEVRMAFGAAAPIPLLVTGTVASLEEMTAQARPISDVRGGAAYRQAMLLVMARRALEVSLGRLRQ